MAKQEQSNPRWVLVPALFQGHLNPMPQLGTVLKSRGFFIKIVHPQFNSTDRSADPDFDFIYLNDGVSESDSRSGNLIRLFLKLNASCEASFQEGQNNYLDKGVQGQDVVGIVFDPIMYFAEAVARRLNVWRAGGPTSSILSPSMYGTPSMPNVEEKKPDVRSIQITG